MAAELVAAATAEPSDIPLSLCRLLDPQVLADPYPLYRALRERDRVYWDPYLHAWVVTGYAEVVSVLLRLSAECAPSAEQLAQMGLSSLEPIARVTVKQMLFMDGAAHVRLRRLCSTAFTSNRVAALRSHIQDIADRLLDRVVAQGSMDVVGDFASPLPAIVMAELLGLPTRDHGQLKAWSADFAEVLGNFQQNPDRAGIVLRSLREMTEYLRAAISEQERRPGDGLIHALVHAEVDGARLTQEEVIANVIITMVGADAHSAARQAGAITRSTRHSSHRSRGASALRDPKPANRARRAGGRGAWRQADAKGRYGLRGDGCRQPGPRAIS